MAFSLPLFIGSRGTAVTPYSWVLSRASANVDEGANQTFTITRSLNNRPRIACSIKLRVPTTVGGNPITATEVANFSGSLENWLTDAAALDADVTYIRQADGTHRLLFTAAWDGTFSFDATTLDDNVIGNPSLRFGLEIFKPIPGTLGTAAVSFLIDDATGGTLSIPVNAAIPTISDTTPAVDEATTCSPGTWTNNPTTFEFQWQNTLGDAAVVGLGSIADVASGDITLNLPAGTQNQDVLVAMISYRSTAAFTLPAGWALCATQQSSGNTTASSVGSIGSCVMAWIKRGVTDPDTAFLRTAGSAAQGRILALRGIDTFDIGSVTTAAVASADLSTPEITTAQANEILVMFQAHARGTGGREQHATDPANLTELAETNFSNTPFGGLVVATGLKTTAGATGTFTAQAITSARHVLTVAAFIPAASNQDITDAESAAYTPATSDVDLRLRCGVRAGNAAGFSDWVYSDLTEPVAVEDPTPVIPVISAVPVLSTTTPSEGTPITCSTGVWDNFPDSFAYQWEDGGVDIVGATSATYPSPVEGEVLRCGVIATNTAGSSTEAFSAASSAVAAATPLTNFTFDNVETPPDGIPTIYVTVGATTGTLLGTAVSLGGTLASIAIISGGAESGRLAVDGLALEATASPLDYEGGVKTRGIPFYFVSIRGSGGGVSIDKTFRLAPIFTVIEATGAGPTPSETVNPTTFAELRAALVQNPLAPTTNTKLIEIGAGVTTHFEANADNTTQMNASNVTLKGHRRTGGIKDKRIRFNSGVNQLVQDWAFRVGADQAGAVPQNRDSHEIEHVINHWEQNCSYSWSTDETSSFISDITAGGVPGVTGHPRYIRISRGLFAEALTEAGHPEGFHNFGPLVSKCMYVHFDKCVFLNFRHRSPAWGESKGCLLTNCIIGYNSSPSAVHNDRDFSHGTSFGTGLPPEPFTADCRGNLYFPMGNSARQRAFSIAHTLPGGPAWINCHFDDPNGPLANHFFNPVGLNFSHDPVTINDINYQSSGEQSSEVVTPNFGAFVDWEPFRVTGDYGYMESDTEAKRLAIWNDVIYKCGVHARDGGGAIIPGLLALGNIDYRILTEFILHGTQTQQTGGYPNGAAGAFDAGNISIVYDTGIPSALGTITLDVTVLDYDSVELGYPDDANASFHEYRVDEGTAVTVPADKIIRGLQGATEHDFEVRAVSAEENGDWSNLVTRTTNAIVFPLVRTYTNIGSTTLLKPTGAVTCTIECYGSGGGGRGISNGALGGGGGAYSRNDSADVSGFTSVILSIPAGAAINSTGGDTEVDGIGTGNPAPLCLAKGGQGRGSGAWSSAIGGQAVDGVGNVKFSGGSSTTFDGGPDAGGGGAAGPTSNGVSVSGSATGGAGGGGIAGAGGNATGSPSQPGNNYGGGGAASIGQNDGQSGAGAQGAIKLTWNAAAAQVPVNTTIPTVNDTTPTVGQVMGGSNGSWNPAATSFTYQWQKGTTNISGATSDTYTVVAGDAGSTLRRGVKGVNAAGSAAAFAFSLSTSAVAAAPSSPFQYFGSNTASRALYSGATSPGAYYDAGTNKTWCVWEGATPAGAVNPRTPWVRVYDHSTLTWSSKYQVGSAGLSNDDHGIPNIARHSSGHYYVVYGSHFNQAGGAQPWSRTTNPNDPSAWTALTPIAPSSSDIFAYPKAVILGNNLYLFSRSGTSSFNLRLSKATISADGLTVTWQFKNRVLVTNPPTLPDGTIGCRHYVTVSFVSGTKIYLHSHLTVANVNPTSALWSHYIMVYETATDRLQNAANTFGATSFPISAAAFNGNFRLYEGPGSGYQPQFDHLGNLHAWWDNYTAGATYTQVLSASTNTWSAATAAGVNGPYIAYLLPDGRMEKFTINGAGLTRQTRSLAGVWGATSIVWAPQRSIYSLDFSVIQNGGPQARLLFAERNGPDPNNNETSLVSNPPDRRIYLWSDAGVISAPA